MECCASTVYALLLEPDLDLEDFRYGQLLALATLLALAVMTQLLLQIFI
jgi:hypothetical protein